MTTRREIGRRLRSLDEIRGVMNSMKTLATMETHKLARFLAIQQRQVAAIEMMAADLLAHYPDVCPTSAPSEQGLILIGAERGFCGDFNDRVARAARPSGQPVATGAIIAVGARLGTRLEEQAAPVIGLDGASATEQVASVLEILAQSIATVQQTRGPLALTVVYHGGEDGDLRKRALFPPFAAVAPAPRSAGFPPRLQLPPPTLFAALLDQYLYAVLSEILYTS